VKEAIENKERIKSGQSDTLMAEGISRLSPWPFFDEDEIQAAASVLRSGKVNQWTGEEVEKFQQEFAAFCGVKHGIALTNGSVALELALKALGIGPGAEVVVTPRTFIASASCVVLQGAIPVFADVDRDSQNIHVESIRKVLSSRTRAIIAVHLAGWPCNMEPILELAREYEIKVIEDCAQAHGARYRGKPVGSFGHMAAFSFCQDKIMTTGGEGGMLLTDDDELWAHCWSYKDHGKSYESVFRKEHPPGFRWVHDAFGTNWRMTEMQAAIGRIQLTKLPKWLSLRKRNADILTQSFSHIPALRVTRPHDYIEHAYYKYYVFIRPEYLKDDWNARKYGGNSGCG
jgi:dTDP-4-amino-4,6-dideoxygalactose transaminase